jgi:bacterioferritin
VPAAAAADLARRPDAGAARPRMGNSHFPTWPAIRLKWPASGSTPMKGDTKVIEFLNKVLYNELTAINQYFLHAKMLKNWGIKELAEHEYKESIDEMKHADMLADRILFLEGLPNFQALGKLRIGENPPRSSVRPALERDACRPCARPSRMPIRGDYVSRQLFVKILDSEEEHIDWLETQLDLIERIGEPKYLLSKLEE